MAESEISMNAPSVAEYMIRLIERSDDIFWVKDVNSDIFTYVSQAIEKLMEVPREKFYENKELWLDSIHSQDREAYREQYHKIKHASHQEKSYTLDYRIKLRNNEIYYIHEVIIPIFDSDEHLIWLVGVAKNITTEKMNRLELENSARYFQLFTEKIKAAFWVREYATNKQLYVSPGYEAIWGRSREAIYQDPKSFLETVHPDDRAALLAAIQIREDDNIEEDTIYHESRYRIFKPDHSLRYIKDTSFPIRDDQNNITVFAGLAEDITKEVEYENALREAKEKAELANKAKSDFLAMISHELRTPLNAIMGMSEILLTKNISGDMKENITLIHDAGKNLLSLVSDVLDFARLEAGKLSFVTESFSLIELFQHTIDAMAYFVKDKDIHLMLNIAPGLNDKVVGDPNRVRQVLTNLLSNAIKFTDKGGVMIYLKGAPNENNEMCFDVRVQDTGVGIPSDKLNMIFEKFSQVDAVYQRRHGGIGLGLSITKELVEVMQGSIDVASELGKGSCFHFTLTLSLQTAKEQEDNAWREAMLHGDKRPQFHKRVLLVEDNLINQRIARMMLEDFGCQMDVLNNGQEVMAKLHTMKEYDLIFLDIGLPDMNGFEISARLREQPELTKIPIVAMTAHVLESDRAHAAASGMDAVLGKPISYDEVRKVLTRYL